jgi:hypothetical protein
MNYNPLLDASSLLSKLSSAEAEAIERSLSIIGTGGELPDLGGLHRTIEDVAIDQSIRELLSSSDQIGGQLALREPMSFKRSVPNSSPHTPQFEVTPLSVLNFLASALIKKRYNFGVVLTARNEGRYLTEWLIHYQLLGADKFIVYYNDSTDGMVELLDFLAPLFNITILDNSAPPKTSPQLSAYAHAIQALREVHECEWVAFFDADEFLFFDSSIGSIHDAISYATKKAEHEIHNICINWKWFVSTDTFRWKPGRTTTRFSNCFPHSMKKCIFRPQYALSLERVHFPTLLSGAKSVTPDGEAIENIALDTYDTCSNTMFLNHYFARRLRIQPRLRRLSVGRRP